MLKSPLRTTSCAAMALCLATLAWTSANAQDVLDVSSRKQVFADPRLLGESDGVTLTMNTPYQFTEPVLVADAPWEQAAGATVWNKGTVRREGDTIRLWYHLLRLKPGSLEAARPEADGEYVAYAESRDGIHFTKPQLGLHGFGGTPENNLVILDCRGCSVWLDPKAPPERRYRTQTKGEGGLLHFHHSADGIRWEKTQALELGDCDTQSIVFWDSTIERYVLYTRTWVRHGNKSLNYRFHRRLESDDLEHWNNETPVMKADAEDLGKYPLAPTGQPPVDYYGACVLRYPEEQGVYLMLAQAFWHWFGRDPIPHPGPNAMDVRMSVSVDGKHFERLGNRRPFLRTGPEGSTFSRMVWAFPRPIRVGDELWFYYFGSNMDHAGQIDPASKGRLRTGIGRAVLRLDGFVSADAGYNGGVLTTPAMRFTGNALELNVDTSAGGVVYVEVLDESGTPVEGLTRGDALPTCGNSVRMPVQWRGEAALSALQCTPVRLRFHMTDCKLYAFQFVDRAQTESN